MTNPTGLDDNGGKTGHPPGLLQDDCRKLHKWFASRPDARYVIRKLFGETNAKRHLSPRDIRTQEW